MELKLLIAEDEQIEREFLKKLMKDYFPSIKEIILAENGQEAIDLFRRHQPKIVLIDIDMPLKDGLTALQEMQQASKDDFTSIILTSYNDFSFAQKSIQLHVSDYILKPAEPALICKRIMLALENLQKDFNYQSSVGELMEEMKQTNALIEPEFVYAILNQTEEKAILEYMRSKRISGTIAICLLLNTSIDHEAKYIKDIIFDCGYDCISAKSKDLHILYIFSTFNITAEEINRVQRLLNPFLKKSTIRCVWGNPKSRISEYYKSYQEAKERFDIHTIDTDTLSEKQFIDRTVKELLLHVEDNQISIVLYEFVAFLMHYSSEKKRYIHRQVLHKLYQYAFQNGINNLKEPDYTKLVICSKNDSLHKAVYVTTQYFLEVLKPIKEHQYQNHSMVYKKAIHFIKQNYKKSIGLHDVGKYLDVTPHYISRILSKEGGPGSKSFVEILTDYRIEESKRLIQQAVSLKEVSYQVGFHSLSYFSKCFKKSTGLSPKEYQSLFQSYTPMP